MSSSDNILWQGIYGGPNPPGRGDGVLGVAQEPVLLLAHQAPVHCAWLECVYEVQDGDTAPEALVLEQCYQKLLELYKKNNKVTKNR